MCDVNPGSSCVPPRRRLLYPVRPTVPFPGKMLNQVLFIFSKIHRRCGSTKSPHIPSTVLFMYTGFGHLLWRAESLLVLAHGVHCSVARHYSRLFNSLARKSINFASVSRTTTTTGASFCRYTAKMLFLPGPRRCTRRAERRDR